MSTKCNKLKKFETWECPVFDAEKQMIEIWNESFSLKLRLQIVTLMIKIKRLVTEKQRFDARDESFLETTF